MGNLILCLVESLQKLFHILDSTILRTVAKCLKFHLLILERHDFLSIGVPAFVELVSDCGKLSFELLNLLLELLVFVLSC